MVSNTVAAIISFFFPGIGQLLLGETQKGIIMFVVAIILTAVLNILIPSISIIYLLYAIWAAYDAYKM